MAAKPKKPKKLPAKQALFVENYIITNCNGAEAARLSGYSEKTARTQASAMLTNIDIQKAISAKLKAKFGSKEYQTDKVLNKLISIIDGEKTKESDALKGTEMLMRYLQLFKEVGDADRPNHIELTWPDAQPEN